jgi:Flp pilus assembly pilin Flp
MARVLKRLWSDQRGEDLVEYGLLVAFAAAVVTVALINDPIGWRPALIAAFTKVKNALNLQ